MKDKKLNMIIGLCISSFVVACGPSAKEVEDRRVFDSIRVSDSLAMIQAEQQRIMDSIENGKAPVMKEPTFIIEEVKRSEFVKDFDSPSEHHFACYWCECKVKNNSGFKFSRIDFDATLQYEMKDGEMTKDYAQTDIVENHLSFRDVDPGAEVNIKFKISSNPVLDRTPTSVTLHITCRGVSVDAEINESVGTFDVLSEWKECQKKCGFR